MNLGFLYSHLEGVNFGIEFCGVCLLTLLAVAIGMKNMLLVLGFDK